MGDDALLLPLLLFVSLTVLITGTYAGHHEKELMRFLFRDYASLERPVENENETLRVELGLTLQQIIDMDEKNQILHTNIWLFLAWNDYKLRWNPADYGGIGQINIPVTKIWKPDVLMYNSANAEFDATYPTNCPVTHDGNVTWIPPGMFASTCSIDITWFPFDEQACDMKFGSWTYDGTKINLTLSGDAGITSSFIKNGEWTLLDVPAKRNSVFYECCPDTPYLDITYTVKIRRRSLYYMFNLVLPCAMISSITLMVFILPPEGGKIGLGVTILLSLTVFLMLVAETLPPTSDAVPLIGIYFVFIMFICSLSVVFTVIVLNYNFRTHESHTMPSLVKLGVCYWLAFLLRMQRPGLVLNKNSIIRASVKLARMQDEISDQLQIDNVNYGDDDMPSNVLRNRRDSGVEDGQSELFYIYKELRFMTDKMREKDRCDAVAADWQFAARVIDRLCLYLFSFVTIISSMIILFSAPNLFS